MNDLQRRVLSSLHFGLKAGFGFGLFMRSAFNGRSLNAVPHAIAKKPVHLTEARNPCIDEAVLPREG